MSKLGPLLGLALLLAVFLAPIATVGRAFVYRDLLVYTAPQDALLREALLERRELPRIDPYMYAGVAHLADPATQTLYPPRLMTATLFEVPRSIAAYVALHIALAAFGAYLLGRALRASRPAAAGGAAVYALSGPVLSVAENFPLLAGAAWLPFAVAGALEARRGSVRSLLGSGLAIALATLGGDLQGATWAALLATGILVHAWLRGPRELRGLARAAVPVLLALGLSGALLVPAANLRPATDRKDPLPAAVAGAWSLAPERAIELVVPFPWGVSFPDDRTIVDGLEPKGSPVTEPWCETVHVGALGLLLGLAALGCRRSRSRAAWLLALAGSGILLALGPRAGVWSLVRALVPFYETYRYPEKHVVLFALAASGLASVGLDALRSPPGRSRAARTLGIAGVVLLVLGLLAAGSLERGLAGVAAASRRPSVPGVGHALAVGIETSALGHAALAIALAAALAWLPAKRRRWPLILAALVVSGELAVELRPRLFLGDATLYDERPLGSELVRASGARVLRWPRTSAERLGRIFTAQEQPSRSREERAIAARVRSWTGAVAVRERCLAAHGFASFTPLAIDRSLPAGAALPEADALDALGVRWLVLDARLAQDSGLAPVASSETGVVLVDRGERGLHAPPPELSGTVPGLFAGTLLSSLAAAIAAGLALRASRARTRGKPS